jgi:hypothetical protein
LLGVEVDADALAMASVGGLIGALLPDLWYSHVRLDLRGYRPNPGVASAPYDFRRHRSACHTGWMVRVLQGSLALSIDRRGP